MRVAGLAGAFAFGALVLAPSLHASQGPQRRAIPAKRWALVDLGSGRIIAQYDAPPTLLLGSGSPLG
jgi:D-alanyl-D-alanine carboxypeptidase